MVPFGGPLGSSGPSFGTLGLLGALFGDLWVTFAVALGYLWTALGCLWALFWKRWVPLRELVGGFWQPLGSMWALFGVKNVIKVTFGNHWFSIRKTIFFVGLGGQVEAKMAPGQSQMKPHGRKDCKGEAHKGIRRAKKTKNVAMMCQCEAKRADLGRLREPNPHPAGQIPPDSSKKADNRRPLETFWKTRISKWLRQYRAVP